MPNETKQLLDFSLFINGKWQPAENNKTFHVYNPADGKIIARVAKASKRDTEQAIESARKTFDSGIWSRKSYQERADILSKFANIIRKNINEIAQLDIISSGATRRKAYSDPARAADLIDQTVKKLHEFSHVEFLPAAGSNHNEVWREPIGVVSAITPWNVPLMLAMLKIVPALAMGNSIVVKPASNTPLSTLKIAELASQAGVPDGVLNVVPGPGSEVGDVLSTHPSVNKVAFTGSTEIGKNIMQQASDTIKKVTLELGGKSPGIVLPDADLDIAIPGIMNGFCFHSGQICMSGTRLLVHDSIYEEVLERLAKCAETIKVGDPQSPDTGMGPVISKGQLESILSYIEIGIQEGARLVYGGQRVIVEGLKEGYYVQPTIFADVQNDMRIAQEEIFGPVLAVIRYSTLEEAIEIANDSIYGLAAGVWTKDVIKAKQIVKELRAGTVWINDWHAMRFDAPFGGYKQSGIGRELGEDVLYEYTQTKHVHTSLARELDQRPAYIIF
ncbi:aldehyde dehydrogenase [Bacillus sp. EB600]|uniref:aldehyde dehydrogenase family protein n=1 Tax=Bacillus sp. EB600 TaxID=2806345 RepID=UPI0021099554|nr:aldehyde dehydrogenase family protein [Bacillus sp. EB600]MCQ6279598.1 aldehyde dehydrogenase [Bacillus sp. EB600]